MDRWQQEKEANGRATYTRLLGDGKNITVVTGNSVFTITTIMKNKSERKEEGDKIFNKKLYRLQKYSKKYKSTYRK